MDHKIEVKKKSKVPGFMIGLLIFLIVGTAAGIYLGDLSQKNEIKIANQLVQRLDVATTKVKQGLFEVKLENITGTVRADQTVDLYWQTSGTIEKVDVKVGDHVKKDDVLASLDENTLDQDILNASVDILDAMDDYEELVNNQDIVADTLSTLVTAQKTLEDANDRLRSMDLSLLTDVQLTLAREQALSAELDYQRAIDLFEAERGQDYTQPGYQRRLGNVGGYRTLRDLAAAQYNEYLGNVDQLELQSREAAVKLAEAELEEAEYQYNKALKGPTEAQLIQAQAKIDSYQTKIDTAKIIAPFDGTVTRIDAKVGDVISYSSDSNTRDIFALRIDNASTFYIDFNVSELYINNVQEGTPVTISFAAIPDKTYHGVVTTASDVGVTNGWNVTYEITVAMTDPDENVKAGMTADIDMLIDSVADALYVPQSSVLLKNDKYYLFLKNETGTFDRKEVQLGLVYGTGAQIISDEIKAGDDIQLKVNDEDEEEQFGFFGMMGGGFRHPGPGGPGGGGRPR